LGRIISILTKDSVTKEDTVKIIKKLKGELTTDGNFEQGVIQQGEATVWIYYRGVDMNLDEDENQEINKMYSFIPTTSTAIEISSEDGSKELAIEFCKKFISHFQDAIVDDSHGKYLTINSIDSL
jgi:hypothetical protein